MPTDPTVEMREAHRAKQAAMRAKLFATPAAPITIPAEAAAATTVPDLGQGARGVQAPPRPATAEEVFQAMGRALKYKSHDVAFEIERGRRAR